VKKSSEAKFLGALLVVALALVGVAVYPVLSKVKQPVQKPYTVPKLTREDLIPKGSRMRGKKDAPLVLVEFGDYQCKTCSLATKQAEKLVEQHKDRLSLVFHHIQINASHINAPIMAQAATAAESQGKFWEMHDLLFNNQDLFTSPDYHEAVGAAMKLAGDLKLDMAKFKADFESKTNHKPIEIDSRAATQCSVQVTPQFFIIRGTGAPTRFPSLDSFRDFAKDPANFR
jgi:protein-disulfide isomerase